MSMKSESESSRVDGNKVEASRRKFLSYFPLGVFAGIAGTLTIAAFRFLRPIASIQRESTWLDAIPMIEVKGDKPMMRAVMTEHVAGWSITLEEQQVFILPAHDHKVLSSACPHEGCSVMWRDETNDFFCPCHDSLFGADGSLLSGPAQRGLDSLPSREKDGMLQVKYQSFMNNTKESIPRV